MDNQTETTMPGARPPIHRVGSVLIFNDMINGNLRTEARRRVIEASGLIENAQRSVARARSLSIPIFWVRVERRADRKDVADPLTDAFIASGLKPRPPIVTGSWEASNIDELPIRAEDQVVLKPRYNPFIGTDLELRLHLLGIKTILLGGYSTNIGVESCARTARDLDFDVIVLSDCCYNVERDLHELAITRILPNFARVMPSDAAFELMM